MRRKKPPRKGRDISRSPAGSSQLMTAGARADPAAAPGPRPLSQEFPEIGDPRPWTPSGTAWRRYDSAVVSMNDGTSAALYRRDPEQFRELLRRPSSSTRG